MEIRNIARPDVFFNWVHHGSSRGKVVLERKLGRARHHSQVTPDDAEKLARLSYKLPDISFSVARFSGMPLLTNFESISSLYVQLSCSDGVHRRLFSLVEDNGFVKPTIAVTDGSRITFYWILKKPITRSGFYKVYLMQYGLLQLVDALHPFRDGLDIGSMVPLVGTIDSRTNGLVRDMCHTGDMVDNRFAENYLMSRFRSYDQNLFKKHSRAILEMLTLLEDRVLLFGSDAAVEDWIIFFGASMCHFCTASQLIRELRALAVSLRATRWSQIEEQYGALIDRVARTAVEGHIMHRGIYMPIDRDDWFSLVSGKLNVSRDEIDRLGLTVLADSDDEFAPLVGLGKVRPVGEVNFVPFERLFVKAVA